MTNSTDQSQVATKADIQRIEVSLEKFATKSDLERFATKADLEKLATKEEIKKFVTKTELKNVERTLRSDILRLEGRIENVEDGLKEIETKMDAGFTKLQNTLDKFVGGNDTLRVENEIGTHKTRQLEIQADDHEKRIKQLESSRIAA